MAVWFILNRTQKSKAEIPAYWKRAHHDWPIRVALFFMLAAISIYVLSDDLAFLPHA
jgi:hypothetical protein